MAAQLGRQFLIYVWDGVSAFLEIGSARSNDLTHNNESVDVTTKASAGWVEKLQGAGNKSVSMSFDGVFTDTTAEDRLITLANADNIELYELLSGSGQKYAGSFQITSYARGGVQNGEETFSVTLESSGAVAFSRLKDTIAAQDETDFNGAGSNGSFVGGDGAGGTAYVVNDTITLSDGTVITVDAIDGDDDVTQFTVTTNSSSSFYFPEVTALTQTGTSGSGTEFVLTVGTANVVNP